MRKKSSIDRLKESVNKTNNSSLLIAPESNMQLTGRFQEEKRTTPSRKIIRADNSRQNSTEKEIRDELQKCKTELETIKKQ